MASELRELKNRPSETLIETLTRRAKHRAEQREQRKVKMKIMRQQIARNNGKKARRFSDDQIREIRRALANGHSQMGLARRYGCGVNTIYRIDRMLTYGDVK